MRPAPPLARSILETIGQTPTVELQRLVQHLGLQGRLLCKLEFFSPGASKKDRVALEIIQQARADGSLQPGQTVVELTSGNAGAGFAIVCQALGHPFLAVMSKGNSIERRRQMAALGAEVVLVEQAPGAIPGQVSGADLDRVEAEAQRLVQDRNAFRAHQFELEGSILAHQRHTGPELWDQAEGRIDAYLDCPGTSGSLTGVGRALKARNPSIRVFCVEPKGAAVLAGSPLVNPRHKIQGAGYSRPDLTLFDRSIVHDFLQVEDDEAIEAARLLARLEGIFAGFSTGAHLAAALRLLEGPERGASIAFLACDSGLKYLSTDLYP